MNTLSECILVIGFDADFCYLMQRYVRMSKHRPIPAHQDQDAVREARRAKPVAIIIEIGVPATPGWKALDALKADRDTRRIPIIACSWQQDEEPAYTAEGISVCLRMPILYEQFRDALVIAGTAGTAQRRV